MKEWAIEYDNDVGRDDESFSESWTVTDGERSFRCNNEGDARWLKEQLEYVNQMDLKE